MKKFLSALCASALTAAVAVTGAVPANAAPAYVPNVLPQAVQSSDVIKVQDDWVWKKKRNWNRNGNPNWNGQRRVQRNWNGQNWANGNWNGNWNNAQKRNGPRYGWYNGHRGYRYERPGYRYYNGWWFPAGAFIAGAIVSGAIANSYNQPSYQYRYGGNAHVQWCYNRYRSYRAYDNTFQPYNGPRQQCYSPYD